jgi:class 3 adenylate cyclase/tetratricopeptide (TPR) repeat protein
MATTEQACPSCGAIATAEAKFCSQCASPLGGTTVVTPASDPAQERRQVTVFFSDLSGFTALNERLDPEDVRDIVNKVWDRAGEIVGRYDGRINKLLGDAVMAVFGDPVAHEDDPVRAVRAALELHEAVEGLNRDVEPRIGSPIGMHTGVNTGVVLTSENVLDGKQTGPLGDTINVAARLQSLAETGQVLVGPETRRAIVKAFELEDLGARDLKGKGEPVAVARVIAVARSVTPARRSSRFVGRDSELSLLRDEYERAKGGTPSFVAICAEAGAGKTRLVEEFRNRVANEATWLEGRAYPFAQNIPYYAITDLISNSLGIDESDSAETVRTKLETGIGALTANSTEILAPLLQLYDIEGSQGSSIDREAYRQRLHESLLTLVRAMAAEGPLIVCLQDLHWADPSTVDILRQLAAEHLSSTLSLYNYRPEFSFNEGGIQEIRLSDLSDRDTRELVESLLDARDVPQELVAFLEERTGGNPFFVEEIVNSLLENNTLTRNGESWELTGAFDTAAVPTTIRGVIAARIDRLDAERRRILQEASVIGREFMFTILSQVSGDATLEDGLAALESADLIRKGDVDADLEYLFKHALTQEVSYQGLLRSKRSELHGRVGQAMEKLLEGRHREFAESIAYHYRNSDTRDRAVPYLVIAGKKAIERFAFSEAAAYYQAGYDILLGLPESPERDRDLLELIVEWSLLHYYNGDIHAFERLMNDHAGLLETVDDAELRGMWLMWHCLASYLGNRLQAALEYVERSIALGEEAGSAKVLAYANAQKAWTLQLLGRCTDGALAAEEALNLVGQLTDERDVTYISFKAGSAAAVNHMLAGDLIKARARARDLIDFAQASASRRAIGMAHWAIGVTEMVSGDEDRIINEYKKGYEVIPDTVNRAAIGGNLVFALALAGRLEEARAIIEPEIELVAELGMGNLLQAYRRVLAIVEIGEGKLARGFDELQAMERKDRERGHLYDEIYTRGVTAIIYAGIATGEAKGSLGVMFRNPGFVLGRGRRASKIAHEIVSDMSANLPPGLEGFRYYTEWTFAKLLVKRKKWDEARVHLGKAIAFLKPLGDCPSMRDAQALLATLPAK